jgi:hypothetical protein
MTKIRLRALYYHIYQHIFIILLTVMITIGLLRVTATYGSFWQTWDEPAHIAAGMELVDKNSFTYEPFHPPLARVMGAIGPYLSGIRSFEKESMWAEGHAILNAHNNYEKNLTLARLGMLPFFVLASVVVALWAKEYGGVRGTATALFAVALFSTLPPILAHSGVMALDMACAATVSAALFALYRWFIQPTIKQGALLGFAVGLAVLARLSGIGFLLFSGTFMGILFLAQYRSEIFYRSFWRREIHKRGLSALFALLLCGLTIWGGYRFSTASLMSTTSRPHLTIDRVAGQKGWLHDIAYFIVEDIPVPAPEFRNGIGEFFARNKLGHLAYLWGDIRRQGWWYFFPVIVCLKTPLSFLFLSGVGGYVAFKQTLFTKDTFRLLAPIAAIAGILAVGMLGHVNNGVRQILSIYPLLAIIAGHGAATLISNKVFSRMLGMTIVTVLLSWQLVASFSAHPDYLAYFNELAGPHPEQIVVDSDLDWGQDLKRLSETLKRRNIKKIALQYNGSIGIDLDRLGLPPRTALKAYQKTTGWIAISLFNLQLGTTEAPYDQFYWLKQYQPMEKVGKSIWLYYIPEA